MNIIIKGLASLRNNGLAFTAGKTFEVLKTRRLTAGCRREARLSCAERRREEAYPFRNPITISILTPLFNTPLPYLGDLIASVQAQTYPHWELCLCDASDAAHGDVGAYCRAAAAGDGRIRVQTLARNGGISENTNACAAMASGAYLALLDHDDMLHPAALFDVAREIACTGADFVYTDEAKFTDDPRRCFQPNHKPDFAREELRAHNYICHLTVYGRALFDRVGGYRTAFDGSQDHDIVLRMTELAGRVVHIPKIRYFWRVHPGSVAGNLGAKQYAVDAARRAVAEQLSRCGEEGAVQSIEPYQTIYRTSYRVGETPQITVVIYGAEDVAHAAGCVCAVDSSTGGEPVEYYILCPWRAAGARSAYSALPTARKVTVVTASEPGRADAPLNAAVQQSGGAYLVFLHAGVRALSPGWLQELLMHAARAGVGAVGAKVVTARGSVADGGVAVYARICGLTVKPMFRGEPYGSGGYEAALAHVREVSAVTGLAVMVGRDKLDSVGYLRKEAGRCVFVDLCLRLGQSGLGVLWTPFAQATLAPGERAPRGCPGAELSAGHQNGALPDRDPFAPRGRI